MLQNSNGSFPGLCYHRLALNQTNQAFEACLFHPNVGNEVVNGKIFLDRRSLRFHSDVITEEIPLERVRVEMDKDGERVYFYDSDRPELRIFTLDASVLECRSIMQSNHLREQISSILSRREIWRRLRITLYFFVGCSMLAWFASWGTSVMVRSLAARVSPEYERKFGDAQIEKFRDEMSLVDDSNQLAQLTALAAPLMRVVPTGKTGVKFYIMADPTPNAFALPGGYVVVNTGLLRMSDRPEEVLGVLAHEMAHVTQKHHFRHVISAAGPLLIFGVFLHSRDQLLNVLSAGSGVMVYQGFSQEYEKEADDVGWSYLVAANIDPRGMISMFRKLKVLEAEEDRVAALLPQAFRSHPALDKRIARLETKWTKLPRKTEFIQLTNQIPRFDPRDIPERIFKPRLR
jgi:Zn-dependent protease with chaperone function